MATPGSPACLSETASCAKAAASLLLRNPRVEHASANAASCLPVWRKGGPRQVEKSVAAARPNHAWESRYRTCVKGGPEG